MTEQEKINAEVQMKLALQDAKFNVFMQEMKDFKNEMRDRDNQRAEDIRELRQDIKSIRADMENMLNSNRNLNIVTILGVAAIVIAVLLK
ncbi:MAG: hypothetical protein IKD80_09050 [Selenomonadaceae bacterium]|nr:hypothetical protein [Selenomonadaceae bacterium]